ncbi:hypothetical protein LJR066_000636 [Acidovorax sp. LjRoot66]|uniref:hypothetical protein n=1 Tax=Acidovorax sp. LjRoot66 TaxID=3342334 RepID=UPI003ED048F2
MTLKSLQAFQSSYHFIKGRFLWECSKDFLAATTAKGATTTVAIATTITTEAIAMIECLNNLQPK